MVLLTLPWSDFELKLPWGNVPVQAPVAGASHFIPVFTSQEAAELAFPGVSVQAIQRARAAPTNG